MTGRRCAAGRCGRFVRAGEVWCRAHGQLGAPAAEEGLVERRQEATATAAAAATFRRRLAEGDIEGLIDPMLSEVLDRAASDRSLGYEIGALRVVLARLLKEEEDPGRLATSAARVASVSVQAAKAQGAMGGAPNEDLAEIMSRLVAEMDAEEAALLGRDLR